MGTILVDYYKKRHAKEDDPGKGGYAKFIQNVNQLYKYLYDAHILQDIALFQKDYPENYHFCVDTKDLYQYYDEIKWSGVPDIENIIEYLFNKENAVCEATGAFQLSAPMNGYRSVDGCVTKTYECYMAAMLQNSERDNVSRIYREKGTIPAIQFLYQDRFWK